MAQMRCQLHEAQHTCIELQCTNIDELYRRATVPPTSTAHPQAEIDVAANPVNSNSPATTAQSQVMESMHAELKVLLTKMKAKLHERADLEVKARQLLDESRRRELVSTQRLSREAQRVHTLEQMRVSGAIDCRNL